MIALCIKNILSITKFLDALCAFTWAVAIGNRWSTCLGVNILILFSCVTSYLALSFIVEQSLQKLMTSSCASWRFHCSICLSFYCFSFVFQYWFKLHLAISSSASFVLLEFFLSEGIDVSMKSIKFTFAVGPL